MPTKTYGQVCSIARALDVLGDRWTLLVVREFLLGPKRFKELQAKLPVMGTNRLSERLTSLMENGVIRPTTLLESAAAGYELTELGEQLRQPMIALGLWGLQLPADERVDPSSARAELMALCLTGASDPESSVGLHETYEFHVGEEVFHFRVSDGRVLARSGSSPEAPTVQVSCDVDTFRALALRQITPTGALREGRAKLKHGTSRAFARVFRVLDYRQSKLRFAPGS